MNDLISIIVPAYNVAPWLSRCLDSIIHQTYQNIEVIVIDDGSTDGTSQILDEYVAKDSRIVAIHQSNAGLVAVRNKGITMATGSYITFVDGDDAIEPNIYERLLNNAKKYNADISHCGVAFCCPDGHIEPHYGSGKVVIQDNFDGQKALLEGILVEPSLCNKLYKAELLLDSCIDINIVNNEDLLRNFVLFQRSQLSVFEDFCGYRYYQRSGSLSKSKDKSIEIARDIQRARSIIVKQATKEIYPYAMQSWLSSIVNTVNFLTFQSNTESKLFCQQCRSVLKQEEKNLHYLIPRQQYAAKLIITCPQLHKFIYGIYRRLHEQNK